MTYVLGVQIEHSPTGPPPRHVKSDREPSSTGDPFSDDHSLNRYSSMCICSYLWYAF